MGFSIPKAALAAHLGGKAALGGQPETECDPLLLKLQRDLRLALEGLTYQTGHDLLTGLYNRSAILDILPRELARSDRQHRPFAVIFLAVDNFKAINEFMAERVGDSVLRAVSRKILHLVRPSDTVGRTGGNQFVILAPGCPSDAATRLAERIRQHFVEHHTDVTQDVSLDVTDDPHPKFIPVTLSLGVFTTQDARNADLLLRRGKEALATARQDGGNRVVVSSETATADDTWVTQA